MRRLDSSNEGKCGGNARQGGSCSSRRGSGREEEAGVEARPEEAGRPVGRQGGCKVDAGADQVAWQALLAEASLLYKRAGRGG